MPQPILRPFLKVSPSPTDGEVKLVPYGANIGLVFEGPKRADIRLCPQLYGKFLVLGANQKLSPQVARAVLDYLRADMPRFYRLRAFLLREVPAGSSEKTVSIGIVKFSPDRVELRSFQLHTVH